MLLLQLLDSCCCRQIQTPWCSQPLPITSAASFS